MGTKELLKEIRACQLCSSELPNSPKPILQFKSSAKLIIIGQAPGAKVHETSIPWNDRSGERLKEWLGLSNEEFYNVENVAIIPMGFCYPGTGESGDMPPRPICAKTWHQPLFQHLKKPPQLILLIGRYAQNYYLPASKKRNMTDLIRRHANDQDLYFPLPHPSPRNVRWFLKNKWFDEEILPVLKHRIEALGIQ